MLRFSKECEIGFCVFDGKLKDIELLALRSIGYLMNYMMSCLRVKKTR